MTKKIEITIKVPKDATSHSSYPFIEYDKFIKYCKANRVDISKEGLASYERNKLLFPCIRLMLPRELLRRRFRLQHPPYKPTYNAKDEWIPLIELEELLHLGSFLYFNKLELEKAIDGGHQLERALKDNNTFVLNPENSKFKNWDKYFIIEGKLHGVECKSSRAKHYYSPWKIFLIEDLNILNTIEDNIASGSRRDWHLFDKKLRQTPLCEFAPFFIIITSYAYRRNLLIQNYTNNTNKTKTAWMKVRSKTSKVAIKLFPGFTYKEWIRFLRKLVALREDYRDKRSEKYLLSLEIEAYISRTISLICYAKRYKFQRISDDYSGRFKNKRDICCEDEVLIYPGILDEIFPDERWDLEQNVRWVLEYHLNRLNESLDQDNRLPDALSGNLFEELVVNPTGTALAAIRKIHKHYNKSDLHRDNEIWSGIRDFAVSIEGHGKKWLGGSSLDGTFMKAYDSKYQILRKTAGKESRDADNAIEFIRKLKYFQTNTYIANNQRCGRHLLIALLTRNFSSHGKVLSGTDLRNNLATIFMSLIDTLFILYASYLEKNSANK